MTSESLLDVYTFNNRGNNDVIHVFLHTGDMTNNESFQTRKKGSAAGFRFSIVAMKKTFFVFHLAAV